MIFYFSVFSKSQEKQFLKSNTKMGMEFVFQKV